MIEGRWFVGPHAVAAYRARIEPGASYEGARAAILAEAAAAHLVRPLPRGGELWRGPRPRRLRLVVVPPAGAGGKVVATVLPACEAARRRT